MTTETFFLPGGYIDPDGVVHREIELAQLSGFVEEYLHDLPAGTSSAQATTGLLGRSIRRIGSLTPASEDLARELLIGDREFALMKLREMTWGSDANAFVRCPNEECSNQLEISLSLAAMSAEPRPVSSRYFYLRTLEGPVEDVKFRLPNGGDQEAVAAIGNEAAAVTVLLARCTGLASEVIETIPPAAQRGIEEEIERLAPQAEAELEAICPECGRVFSSSVHWPEFCLNEMRSHSAGIDREIHFLALHYHWSESELLSMPHKKRRRYVALLEEEIERLEES